MDMYTRTGQTPAEEQRRDLLTTVFGGFIGAPMRVLIMLLFMGTVGVVSMV